MPVPSFIAAPPKRRWFQYSLWTLFVVISLLCGIMAWIVIPVQRQITAVQTMKQFGGTVRYAKIPDDESWWRQELRNVLPRDYFDSVVRVELLSATIDSDLTCLAPLTQLEFLGIYNAEISDAGLAKLKNLTQLEDLFLGNTRVTDEGLVHLKGLTKLRILHLNKSDLTDAGLANLKELKQLEGLLLGNTRVTDEGLLHLKGLTKLSMLFFQGSHVTDEGEKILKQALPNCTVFR